MPREARKEMRTSLCMRARENKRSPLEENALQPAAETICICGQINSKWVRNGAGPRSTGNQQVPNAIKINGKGYQANTQASKQANQTARQPANKQTSTDVTLVSTAVRQFICR